MSFKREGNDGSLLGALKKRRIKDLLAEDIPEDEAKLLSNGRFACLVCGNHPIFDTVSMLSVHRHGKKHKHYQDIHNAKKKELESLIWKRRQEEILKYGKTSIPMKTAGKPALGQSPYNPCAKKGRAKTGGRRQCLDLNGDKLDSSFTEPGTSTESSPSHWRQICEQQVSDGPVVHEKQLKNIFKGKAAPLSVSDVQVTPYQSNRTQGLQKFSSSEPPASKYGQFNLKTRTVNSSRLATQTTACPSGEQCFVHGPESEGVISPERMHTIVGYSDITVNGLGLSRPRNNDRIHSDSKITQTSQARGESVQHGTQCSPPLPSQSKSDADKDLAKKYRLLQGSGWKKDWDGKWIRDENAEFDSDEEPPDLP